MPPACPVKQPMASGNQVKRAVLNTERKLLTLSLMSPVRDVDAGSVSTVESKMSTEVDRMKPLSVLVCILLCIPALFLTLSFCSNGTGADDHVKDFTGFLVGAKLLGTQQLYSVPANLAVQKELTGTTQPAIIFVRLPFWALAMRPFLALSYHSALVLWRALMGAALVAFSLVSPSPRRYIGLTLCWSLSTMGAIALGNDSPLVLLCIGLSLICWKKGWRLAAGAALALCLGKFHFLMFLPLLLFRPAYRRVLIGFSAVAALLLAVNFAVQPDWIRLYWDALNLPQANMNAYATLMPNFYASFFWTGRPAIGVAAGALVVAAALWPLCRRLSFDLAMPLCIFGGLLAAPHTNYVDWILATPALFGMMHYLAGSRLVGWFLLSPLAGLLCSPGTGLYTIGAVIIVTASLWMLWMIVRATSSRITMAGSVNAVVAGARLQYLNHAKRVQDDDNPTSPYSQ